MEYRKLGRFQLEELVAQGGMGEIIRSTDASGRPIALKTILKNFQDNDAFRELFIREAEITFQLDHPNIVKAYRFDTIGNRLCLALEYLDGVNLKDVLRYVYDRKLQIPYVIASAIMSRVLEGLEFAHKKCDREGRSLGIVHRDLNPSNVFITYAGEVKILDFGISKATQVEFHQLTPKGELRGKLSYLSPEQLAGEQIDHRSDIFACGILLWELLAGRPLYLRNSNTEVMEAIACAEYSPLAAYRSDLPADLEEILKKALSLKAKHRFRSCQELNEALRKFNRGKIMPGVAEEEISIFVRTIFKKGVDDKDANFMAGYAWLLTQLQGQEQGALELAKKIAAENPTRPFVQLNLARAFLSAGQKQEGLRIIKRLARVDSLEEVAQEVLEWAGVRRPPVISFLKRSHPINHALGLIRHKIKGPTPYQNDYLAA